MNVRIYHSILLITSAALICSCADKPAEYFEVPNTYCNPINLDYAYVPSTHTYYAQDESHRSTADPAVVNLRDTLYLFSTNQNGYWWSADMRTWNFVRQDFQKNGRAGDNVCAPGAWAWGDSLLFIPSFVAPDPMPLYLSTDPKNARWTILRDSFEVGTWDPSFFKDDDGKAYVYWGSSNFYPLYGVELDAKNGYKPIGERKELSRLYPDEHGWERFGEDHMDTTIAPYTEGPWMTKHNGKYYYQYAAPGTEWNIYADGVLVGDNPLGPFEYQSYNPFSYKPGGFITGAGHGSTFKDKHGNYWHAGTMLNWIKYKFERRLGIFPTGFDDDGQLYCITAFGDYPNYHASGLRDHRESTFTGWMLQSYKKKVWASSSLPGRTPELAVNENIRNYWSAETNQKGEFLAVDLGAEVDIYAIQINYADEGATLRDKQDSIYHQYIIWNSHDGDSWNILIDKSKNRKDVPHDYIELKKPFTTRYLKLENVHMADGKFAIAGFRVFGKRDGALPKAVESFAVRRHADTRDATFTWQPVEGAYAYNIYYGIAPDKLYNCIMIHESAERYFRGLNKDVKYFAQIEAIGETGVSNRSNVIEF
ncbi:MAG: family 43 glycosylhydrolase [Cyclobacteriaceae bacterium]|nr:MAG: family 43 glycosylhydrolase [Cyclobacteriaceae bacterium]